MTNGEAIARIIEHKIVHKMNEPRAIYISEALDMAIEALEQQPCEDCINRADVKEQMIKYGFTAPDMTVTEFAEECLPPVMPQPKIGHWIIVDDCERFIAKCSECGEIVDSRMINKYPYCHCGAKMKEVEE